MKLFERPFFKRNRINLNYLLLVFLVVTATNTFAQVGIGTNTPAASAALEVASSTNNKGILIPRITATQKDAINNPAEGLMIYQTSAPAGFYYYMGSAWKLIMTQTDLDTKLSTVDATTSLNTKVDKVTGKELSSNDYTTVEKTKLAAITGTNTGDQTNITGNAATATLAQRATLASNIDATSNSTLKVLPNLTTLGTITSGTWNGSPIAIKNGGTGSSTLNFVDLSSNQIIEGQKFFSTDAIINGLTIGQGAGNLASNTVLGIGALQSNTDGAENVAFGNSALAVNTFGRSNIAVGAGTLSNNTTGNDNTANGNYALIMNTTGSSNTASGASALSSNTSGDYNVANGYKGLYLNKTGSNNVAIGNSALLSNMTGTDNTAIGANANVAAADLTNATAIGAGAIVNTSNTIQLGNADVTSVVTSGAMSAATYTGVWDGDLIAINAGGTGASSASQARENLGLVIGVDVQGVLTPGNDYLTPAGNAATATLAQRATLADNIDAISNSTLEVLPNLTTLGTITSGTWRGSPIAIENGGTGSSRLNFVDLSSNQTIAGAKSFSSDAEINDLTIGRGAGNLSSNTVLGIRALRSNAGGMGNVAFGNSALISNITGNSNTANGNEVLMFNTGGNSNTAIGKHASYSNRTGSNNVAIGYRALFSNTTGTDNTALGAEANVGLDNLTNATAIGAGARVDASNTIQLGNALVENVVTRGKITASGYGTATGTSTQFLKADGSVDRNTYLNKNVSTIAIGTYAGNRDQAPNSIILNATSIQLNTPTSTSSGFFVAPIRELPTTSKALYYDTATNEISSGAVAAAAAGTLTGTTLASAVVSSSLTSVGTLASATVSGKVIVGASSAASASAVLEASSTTQGFLPPRMTGAQRNRIASPATGLMVYCTNCGSAGGEPQYYNGSAWVNMIGGAALMPPLAIGDAYQGGIIAYILGPSDPGYNANTPHGLIATTTDISTGAEWGCAGILFSGAVGITAIGTGAANTAAIMAGCTTPGIAAELCGNLVEQGYSDWYLPSNDELNKLYINRALIGGFDNNKSYWSSTDAQQNAWYLDFGDGNLYYGPKNNLLPVRAIRSF